MFRILCKNLEETGLLAKKFLDKIVETGAFVCLYGDIGAGKTAFVKLFAKHLEVKEKVTSPSFVILNEYHTGVLPLYHFDLYRLEEEGVKSIFDELLEYSEGRVVTFVEWAEFYNIDLPKNRIEINIKYVDEFSREFGFKAFSDEGCKIIKELEDEIIRV